MLTSVALSGFVGVAKARRNVGRAGMDALLRSLVLARARLRVSILRSLCL